MGIYHEFVNDENKKVREYHIDTHKKLNESPLTLSVQRRASQLRPTIIIGQDESVFKQYSFSQRCWFSPNGETKLLPKNEGYSQMISAFVSRSFGIGLKLTEEELLKVNERRRSEKWVHYMEKSAAMEIYGSTKKKEIKTNSP